MLTLSVKNSKHSDLPNKTQILKHVFNHPKAKSGLRKDCVNDLLTELITALEGVSSQSSGSDGSAGGALVGSDDVMNVPMPFLEENQGSV